MSWTGCGRLYNEIFYWVCLGLCWQQASCILVQFKFEPPLVKFCSPRLQRTRYLWDWHLKDYSGSLRITDLFPFLGCPKTAFSLLTVLPFNFSLTAACTILLGGGFYLKHIAVCTYARPHFLSADHRCVDAAPVTSTVSATHDPQSSMGKAWYSTTDVHAGLDCRFPPPLVSDPRVLYLPS